MNSLKTTNSNSRKDPATKADIHRITSDLTHIKWMLALIIAVSIIPLIRGLI